MIPSSAWPDRDTFSTSRRWRSLSTVEASRLAMPSTPFIGVRISWLIVARNCDLARLAASASSRARTSSASARLRSVMSRKIAVKNSSSPSAHLGDGQLGRELGCPPCGSRVSSWPMPMVPSPPAPKRDATSPGSGARCAPAAAMPRSAPTTSFGRIAEDALRARAPLQDAAGRVDRRRSPSHDRVEDRLQPGAAVVRPPLGRLGLLAGAYELGLGALAIGDVAQDAGEEHLVAVANLADRKLDRELGAVLADRDQLAADADDLGLARRQERVDIAGVARAVRLGHQHGQVLRRPPRPACSRRCAGRPSSIAGCGRRGRS